MKAYCSQNSIYNSGSFSTLREKNATIARKRVSIDSPLWLTGHLSFRYTYCTKCHMYPVILSFLPPMHKQNGHW